MRQKNCLFIMAMRVFLVLIFTITLVGISTCLAFKPGKTYDKSNYQEIEDLLIPSILLMIKDGDFVLETDNVNIDWKKNEEKFVKATMKNSGKYDVSPEGNLVYKETGEYVEYCYGLPFPNIDVNHPKVGQYIMENHFAAAAHYYTCKATAIQYRIDHHAYERENIIGMDVLCYFQRMDGPIENPLKLIKQDLICFYEPYDLRGVSALSWMYIENKQNSQWSYVPMIRRVRRSSPAARSDLTGGSDACADDANGYGGRNADMNIKYIGEKTALAMVSDKNPAVITQNPDGSFNRKLYDCKPMVVVDKNTKYAAYCPTNVIWAPFDMYVIELKPKDPYYASGRMLLYVGKDDYHSRFKESFTHAGEYYKTWMGAMSRQLVPGVWIGEQNDYNTVVDYKAKHATTNPIIDFSGRESLLNLPVEKHGPTWFTSSNMIQMSK